MKCKLHPKYKVIRKPTSKKEGCVCSMIWANSVAEKLLSSEDISSSSYLEVIGLLISSLPSAPSKKNVEECFDKLKEWSAPLEN